MAEAADIPVAFESSVVLDGTKTSRCNLSLVAEFESSVVLDGTKTAGLLCCS